LQTPCRESIEYFKVPLSTPNKRQFLGSSLKKPVLKTFPPLVPACPIAPPPRIFGADACPPARQRTTLKGDRDARLFVKQSPSAAGTGGPMPVCLQLPREHLVNDLAAAFPAAAMAPGELAAAAGSNGHVAALDGVRFSGTFGVSFAQEPKMTKQGLRNARKEGALMETEDDEEARGQMSVESARKKAGFEVARRNYPWFVSR